MARWVNNIRWLIGGLGALASAGISTSAQAQDGAFTELYGYAVHRYYAGDYNEAQRALNIVIDAGIEDSRPHFFRGLVTYQMGMQDAAKADFEHAADLEARGKGVVSVSYALQRIQGPVRRDIELARLSARVAVAEELRAKKQLGATQSQTSPNVAQPPEGNNLPPTLSGDAQPLPVQPAAPDVPPADPTTPPPPPTTPDTQTDPFKDDATTVTPPPPTTDAPTADPFGTAPAAPTTPAPAGDDPFK